MNGPLEPMNNTNNAYGVYCGKLLPLTVLAYLSLIKPQHYCLCPNQRYKPLPATHPLPPPTPSPITPLHATCDITVAVRKVAQYLAVLAS